MRKFKQWFEKSAAIDFNRGHGLILGFILSFLYIELTFVSDIIAVIFILVSSQLATFYIIYGKKMFSKHNEYKIIIYNKITGIEDKHKQKLVYNYLTRLNNEGYLIKIESIL